MEYRILGNTGLKVSAIGLGTWGISGSGYGPVNLDESLKILHTALDSGINFIDTADSYGDGFSENLIGKVLSERKDTETVVATKFGWDFYSKKGVRANLSPDYIRFAACKSLERLKRDSIDIYQIHCPRADRIEAEGVYNTLESLKKEGIVRFYGISISYIEDGLNALDKGYISTIQVPYNLICTESEDTLIPEAAGRGIGIIAREPLAGGLLSGKYSVYSKFHKKDHRNGWSRDYIKKQLGKVERVRKQNGNGKSLVSLAISYVKANRGVSTVIPGCKTVSQLKENILCAEKSTV